MNETSAPPRTYGDADGYDFYMGSWSAALSPLFLEFVGIAQPARVLDIGCGTGNLLAALAAKLPGAALVGVDPSTSLLDKARRRPELGGVDLLEGTAEQLPFERGRFDCSLSMLVLQEFPDRLRALREMRRVTRPGGVVAACQWDFARMPVIDALMEAITAISPLAGSQISGSSPSVLSDEADLRLAWIEAGFVDAVADSIAVTRAFPSFDHLWTPLLAGSTPSTMKLASLSGDEQLAVRAHMLRRFGAEHPSSPLSVTAEALVARGVA
jgi:SAM-dependent methyltransferase